MSNLPPAPTTPTAWARFVDRSVHAFHAYAGWLVSISWRRFFVLSLVLVITVAILHDVPPLSWTYTELVPEGQAPKKTKKKPQTPQPSKAPGTTPETKPGGSARGSDQGVDISIDERGVHVTPRPVAPAGAASQAQSSDAVSQLPGVTIKMPPGADSQGVREAIEEARREFRSRRRPSPSHLGSRLRDAGTKRAAAERLRLHDEAASDPVEDQRRGFGDSLVGDPARVRRTGVDSPSQRLAS